ncbi:mechanosensitive ion channel family protein [Chelatococcus reniformis]|nr:mechanosensitive ion channel family protein [Chelatococcus reniformis]
MSVGTGAAAAEAPAPAAPPADVQELVRLLQNPAVRTWLAAQDGKGAEASSATAEAAAAPQDMSAGAEATRRMEQLRAHFARLAAAVPLLGPELAHAGTVLRSEIQDRRPIGILILVVGFLALGWGVERLVWRLSASTRRFMEALPTATPWQRLRAIAVRLGFDLALVAVFALGSVAAFLAFAWPPVFKQIVLQYLIAAVVFRLVLAISRFVLVPARLAAYEGHRRLVPLADGAATFWYRRIVLFVAWFMFGWATVNNLAPLGFGQPSRALIAYMLGLGLLAIALEVVWRRPRPGMADAAGPARATGHTFVNILLSLYCIALWLLWVGGLIGLFCLGALALLLPKAIQLSGQITDAIVAAPPAEGDEEPAAKPVAAIYAERGVRALLIAGAAVFMAYIWNIDLVALTNRDNMVTRLIRGLLSGVVILLVADLLWQLVKSLIDRKLAESQAGPGHDDAERARRAKLRTLLPIFRNIIFVVLAAMAVLTALAALGVEIGPLIAGAGVVGVAVGFGAQSIVKDVISGMFYLFDDAFRVGEYIVCGRYKGTVESFSLRSIKLRHHRGPIYTVPFGQLGAVENLSRDWVIDKMSVRVTYDSDLDKVKKLIKEIGLELAKDPEFAPHILQPLKLQGIDSFGEFAIEIQTKIMTKPGEQFMIRRRAYVMIREAFERNGIKFAFPTVQVAGGGGDAAAAAAQNMLAANKAAADASAAG